LFPIENIDFNLKTKLFNKKETNDTKTNKYFLIKNKQIFYECNDFKDFKNFITQMLFNENKLKNIKYIPILNSLLKINFYNYNYDELKTNIFETNNKNILKNKN